MCGPIFQIIHPIIPTPILYSIGYPLTLFIIFSINATFTLYLAKYNKQNIVRTKNITNVIQLN